MPQFDFFSFGTQAFWLLVGFSSFYFYFLYSFITKYSEALKFRQKLNLLPKPDLLKTKHVYDLYLKGFFLASK